jgi:hypothetical protein
MTEYKTDSDFLFSSLMARSPQDLVDYIETMKYVIQSRVWHPELDVYTHLKTVTDRVAKYHNINLSIAAMLHDTAKDRTTSINPKTGEPRSPGHARYSAECVDIWRDWIREQGASLVTVRWLILHHMDAKEDNFTEQKRIALMQNEHYDLLEKLNQADRGGTDV